MGKVIWILGNDDFSDDKIDTEDNFTLYKLIKNLKEYFFYCL